VKEKKLARFHCRSVLETRAILLWDDRLMIAGKIENQRVLILSEFFKNLNFFNALQKIYEI
jgi:hypothetical protein